MFTGNLQLPGNELHILYALPHLILTTSHE